MSQLTILSTAIRQDANGRYCLNDCHKASGSDKSKQPANFMRLDTTQALIQEIAENSRSSDLRNDGKLPLLNRCTDLCIGPVETKRGGKDQGTCVCKELVYAYAMWISPSFNLAVIRAFDALVQGDTTALALLTQQVTALSDRLDRQQAVQLYKAPSHKSAQTDPWFPVFRNFLTGYEGLSRSHPNDFRPIDIMNFIEGIPDRTLATQARVAAILRALEWIPRDPTDELACSWYKPRYSVHYL